MTAKIDLGNAIRANVEYMLGDLNTAIPAIIVSVENLGELRVNVQPTLNMSDEYGTVISERPPILNVPVFMPTGRSGGMTYRVSAGDPCFLVFSMRGLDLWKRSNGYPSTPPTKRRFSVKDAIAYVGSFPFSESVNNSGKHSLRHNPEDVVLYHNLGSSNEVEVRLKHGGGVEINAPNDLVTVVCKEANMRVSDKFELKATDFNIDVSNMTVKSTMFTLNSGSYSLTATTGDASSTGTVRHNGDYYLDGKLINGHRHGGVQRGSSTTDPF